MAEHRVGRLDELPTDQAVLMNIDGKIIGVFKVNGQVRAWENRCPHAGGPVCQGEVLGRFEYLLAADQTIVGERFDDEELHVVCPWHGWEFELDSGYCTTDEKFRLRGFETVVRDGEVFVVTE